MPDAEVEVKGLSKRGMGRGLDAILPRSHDDETGLREIPVDLIRPNPRQPRRDFDQDALLGLADSIRSRGLLQPLVVRPLTGGTYELVAGERRLRAAKLAELEAVPAVVRQAEDWERLDLALAENMARVDLNPVEEARACAMLVEDLGLSKAEVGRRIGRSRVAVSNLVRLLELPDDTLELLASGSLSEAHGRAILTARDHDDRRKLAHAARDRGWSVRETERRARASNEGPSRPISDRQRTADLHPDQVEALAAVDEALSGALGRPVHARAKGDGCRVELDFDSTVDALQLAEHLVEQARRAGVKLAS